MFVATIYKILRIKTYSAVLIVSLLRFAYCSIVTPSADGPDEKSGFTIKWFRDAQRE